VEKSAVDFLSNQPVEGELLAERLARGLMSRDEVLRDAIAIGNALAQVHASGFVHGSLSPHSIVLGDSGAIILRPAGAFDTRAYRAPEQVLGNRPDERSDIFSFGAVLYEMAAGMPPFQGEGTALDDAILHDEPGPLGRPDEAEDPVRPALAAAIVGCIAKNPGQRRQRVKSTVLELRLAAAGSRVPAGKGLVERRRRPEPHGADAGAHQTHVNVPPAAAIAGETQAPMARPPRAAYWDLRQTVRSTADFRRRLPWRAGAALAVAAVAGLAYFYVARKPLPVVKFTMATEDARFPGMPAVSPDGRYVTYFAVGPEGQQTLWLRSLDASHARIVPHSEGAFAPFWAPDSQSIGFFANGMLRVWKLKLAADGTPEGHAAAICATEAEAGGASWNQRGTILFAPGLNGGLERVPAAGGKPQPVLKPDAAKSERAYRWPQFLPDGRHFLFFAAADSAEQTGVYAGALDSSEHRLLFASETNAVFSAVSGGLSSSSGYLLFMKSRASGARGGASFDLMGWVFRPSNLKLMGQPFTLGSNIGAIQTLAFAPISVSANAILVYQTVEEATHQLMWLDRGGKPLGAVGGPGDWGPPRISHDGRSVVAGKASANPEPNPDLWLLGTDSAVAITSGTTAFSPVWSPDGSRVAYVANEDDGYNVYVKAAASGARPELLLKNRYNKHLTDWSPDGRYILFGQADPDTSWDVWGLSTADHSAGPIIQTVRAEDYPALSPDGRWIAFQSDDSGHYQVYVQAFEGISPGTRRRWRISTTGGALPRWRGDGRELYFVTGEGSLMAVTVHPESTEFAFDAPQKLFSFRVLPKMQWTLFDARPDGQRFLMNLPLEWSNASEINVMTNWTEALKK